VLPVSRKQKIDSTIWDPAHFVVAAASLPVVPFLCGNFRVSYSYQRVARFDKLTTPAANPTFGTIIHRRFHVLLIYFPL
jgi:hypothetical protein